MAVFHENTTFSKKINIFIKKTIFCINLSFFVKIHKIDAESLRYMSISSFGTSFHRFSKTMLCFQRCLLVLSCFGSEYMYFKRIHQFFHKFCSVIIKPSEICLMAQGCRSCEAPIPSTKLRHSELDENPRVSQTPFGGREAHQCCTAASQAPAGNCHTPHTNKGALLFKRCRRAQANGTDYEHKATSHSGFSILKEVSRALQREDVDRQLNQSETNTAINREYAADCKHRALSTRKDATR